ncbi:MAG: hypothetical protein K940chlam7_00273 [Chlamydiae bacterium]|nr:hypothetical protein [Chlamydiota bacterium]
MSDHDEELEKYGDPRIASGNAKIPGWLKVVYFSLPIWGIIWLFLYWNGVSGWLDRGHWNQLEKAANTTYSERTAE